MSAYEIVPLRNGSQALRDRDSGEIMHPAVGPWAEANTLYVDPSRLAGRLAEAGRPPLRLYDIGLGGAANAVAALTCAAALPGRTRELEVISFESDLAPCTLALASCEAFPFLAPWAPALQTLLATGLWTGPGLRWRLLRGDFLEELRHAPEPAEIAFFDPFSPETNPLLWTAAAFSQLRERAADAFTLHTYSAATPTRVSLLLAGFFVGAGVAVATKKETTVAASRRELLERPLDARWLDRWRRSSARAPHGAPFTAEVEAQVLAHPQFQR